MGLLIYGSAEFIFVVPQPHAVTPSVGVRAIADSARSRADTHDHREACLAPARQVVLVLAAVQARWPPWGQQPLSEGTLDADPCSALSVQQSQRDSMKKTVERCIPPRLSSISISGIYGA